MKRRTSNDKHVYILDTCVFLKPEGRVFGEKLCVTTYSVMEEVRSLEARIIFDMFLKRGMTLMHPSAEKFKMVEEKAREIEKDLSDADLGILALALELKDKGKDVVVVTDDYSLQNLCSFFCVKFKPVSTAGIKDRIKWVKRCVHCGTEFERNECPVCGARDFKFVPGGKKRLNRS